MALHGNYLSGITTLERGVELGMVHPLCGCENCLTASLNFVHAYNPVKFVVVLKTQSLERCMEEHRIGGRNASIEKS